jgi:Tfp pilus assembly protein PilF
LGDSPEIRRDRQAAVHYFMQARQANPLDGRPHIWLGILNCYYQSSESATAQFVRAQKCFPSDPDVWLASGNYEFTQGNRSQACQLWKKSLELSGRHLEAILNRARRTMTSDDILTKILPDNPLLIIYAADRFFESTRDTDRPLFLNKALAIIARRDKLTADDWMVRALVAEERDQSTETDTAYQSALDIAPGRVDIRNRYALWLEREERYGDALPHLELLRAIDAKNESLRDRHDAARHAVRLKQMIDGK